MNYYGSANPFQQYKESSILTATPEELTLMLYDGAIKFLNQAKDAIDRKDLQNANDKLIRVQNIFRELDSTLDKSIDLSDGLSKLYDYLIRRCIEANVKKDNAIIDEILGFARDMRNTWQQAMKLAKNNNAAK